MQLLHGKDQNAHFTSRREDILAGPRDRLEVKMQFAGVYSYIFSVNMFSFNG